MNKFTLDKILLTIGLISIIIGIPITATFLFHKPMAFLGPIFIGLGITLMGAGAYVKYKRSTHPVNYLRQIDDGYITPVSGINAQYYDSSQQSAHTEQS